MSEDLKQPLKGNKMGFSSKKIKNRAIEIIESGDFDEAMNEKFNDEFRDFIKPMLTDNDVITHDDVQGFMDSFTVPDENEWAYEKVDAELADIGDQQYEEERDRKMGL